MNDGSTSIQRLSITILKSETVETFLNLIGIKYINGRIISNRNIEVL